MSQLNNINPPIKPVSFGRHLTNEYKMAERVFREYTNKGWQSPSAMTLLRKKQSQNNKMIPLRALIISKLSSLLSLNRNYFEKLCAFKNQSEYFELQEKLVSKLRSLNCGEYSDFAYYGLTKLGIPCRIVYNKSRDHVFVVVNKKEPFMDFMLGEKGEFVMDLWLKKLYHNSNEAYVDYKRKFGWSCHDTYVDVTNLCVDYYSNISGAGADRAANADGLFNLVKISEDINQACIKEFNNLKSNWQQSRSVKESEESLFYKYSDIFERKVHSLRDKLNVNDDDIFY